MERKRWLYLSILLIPFLTFVKVGYTQPATSPKAAPMVLRVAHFAPPTGLFPTFLNKALNEVEQLTEGRIKAEVYWSDSLIKGREILKGIQRGVCNMGLIPSGYYPAELPLSTAHTFILYVPKGDDAGWIARKSWEFMDKCQEIHEEHKKWGQTIWFLRPYDGFILSTNKKVIRTLEDIKGLRIRVSAEAHAKMLSAIGGNPVFMIPSEVYTALDKGTIDGCILALESIRDYSIHEVARYCTETNILLHFSPLNISLRDVEKMSENDRKTFFEVGRRVSIQFGDALKNYWDETKNFSEKKGVKFFPFPNEERVKWVKTPKVQALIKSWMDEQNAAGRPGTKVMETLLDTFEVPR